MKQENKKFDDKLKEFFSSSEWETIINIEVV